MHSAPSVTYPVGRSRLGGTLLLLLWLAGAAALALWWSEGQASGWRLASGACLWAAIGSWAAARWWRSPVGTLAWDGRSWYWSGADPGATGAVEVSLDLQRSLLVRWGGSGVPRWFWLERARRADRWDDLRRAVYSRAAAAALPDAPAPASRP